MKAGKRVASSDYEKRKNRRREEGLTYRAEKCEKHFNRFNNNKIMKDGTNHKKLNQTGAS